MKSTFETRQTLSRLPILLLAVTLADPLFGQCGRNDPAFPVPECRNELDGGHRRTITKSLGNQRQNTTSNKRWVRRVLRTLAAQAVYSAACERRGNAYAALSVGSGASPT